ncbi:MAG TPA: ATP-binding protein, partial [Bdellovibrio sp.]|nr:ATP-binding protein [Bdellovibrio sp.]
LFTFSEPFEGLKKLINITEPTPYKELNFKTSQGGEGKVQITLQPIFDSMGDKQWIVFVRDVTLEERLQKKYRAELEQKEDVIKDLEKAKAQLEDYSKNLERMVAERTAEIQRMNQMMTALLDSLHQGFFIFNSQGQVLEVSSKACERTIEGRPQGKNIWDVLKLSEKKVEGFKKWMQTLFAEMLPFEDLAPLGPTKYPHSENRHIALEYFPLRAAEGTIDGVVVVASDITSLVEAQEQAEHDRAYAKLIINLVQSKNQIGRFVRESQSLLDSLQTGLKASWKKADSDFLFRQLHTLKGSAALFSIKEMADHCHQAETLLAQFKESPSAESFSRVREETSPIQSAFQAFLKQSEEVLGRSISSERHLEIPFSKFQQTLQQIEKSANNSLAASILLNNFAMESIGSFFSSFNEVAQRVAQAQNKNLHPLVLKNADLRILPEIYAGLFATFVHAFRNSVDHGIETPSEREQKGKPTSGTLTVSFALNKTQGQLTIRVDDDGNGIDPQKIRAKLSQRNLKSTGSDSEIIQHIFDSQFSTRDEVSETSGRGVGMDAIKQAAEELGGRVWVESELGKGTSLFVEVPYITQFNHQVNRAKIAS